MARVIVAIFLCWASGLAAQGWAFSTWDNGHLVHGFVNSGHGMVLRCSGPSRGALDAVSAEAHEDTRTPRGAMIIEIGPERIPLGNAFQRNDVVLWLGGIGYRLPAVSFIERDAVWQVQLPTNDGLFAALRAATEIVLAPGQDKAWSFPATGLASGLDAAMALCDAAWRGQGPAFALSQNDLTRVAQQEVISVCGGTYTAENSAFLAGLIDTDEVPDVVVDWHAIQCSGANPRPLCGASHCSARVFLSSRPGARPEDLLVRGIELIPLNNGRVGLNIFARTGSCGPDSPVCKSTWYWDGNNIVELR